MDKEERTHGDEMATMGALQGLYKTIIEINKNNFAFLWFFN